MPERLRVLDPQLGANAESNIVIELSIETRPKPVMIETEIVLTQYRVLPPSVEPSACLISDSLNSRVTPQRKIGKRSKL